MRLNSTAALELGRSMFRAYGSDWSKVHRAGRVRPDGVIELPSPRARADGAEAEISPSTHSAE